MSRRRAEGWILVGASGELIAVVLGRRRPNHLAYPGSQIGAYKCAVRWDDGVVKPGVMPPRAGDIFEDLDPRSNGRRIRCVKSGAFWSEFENITTFTGRRFKIRNDRLRKKPTKGRGYVPMGHETLFDNRGEDE